LTGFIDKTTGKKKMGRKGCRGSRIQTKRLRTRGK